MTESVRVRGPASEVAGLATVEPPLSTAAWYGDAPLELAFPPDWSVIVHEPQLPQPLTADEMRSALRDPVGAPPLATVAAGARRVVIVVDDLTRPTPADVVLPLLIDELESAGTERSSITIVVATGTHGPASADAVARKVGNSARGCHVISHDDLADCPHVGITRFGTSVFVNRALTEADLVIGLGGVYPQSSTGFGGGSKLAIGVLGRRTIARLHFHHPSMEGRYEVDNAFRADLADVARLVGLRWTAMVHVDARRRVVRLVAGDPEAAYPAAAAFSRGAYAAPLPGDADVVIANAYPMDVSATFMRSKGVIPLLHAAPGASRILLAACPEGVGHHGLFPLEAPTRWARVRRRIEMTRARGWGEVGRLGLVVVRRVATLATRRIRPPDRSATEPSSPSRLPILMYQTIEPPVRPSAVLPASLPGMQRVNSWAELVETIRAQQGRRDGLRVVVYACAPLQVFEG